VDCCPRRFALRLSATDLYVIWLNKQFIRHDDKFKQYTLCGNLDLILKDVDDRIAESPFENDRITEVLQAVFIR